MSVTTHKRVGAAIALLGSTVAAFGALGHLNVQIAVGIAVTAILVGTGVARGKFSGADATKRH